MEVYVIGVLIIFLVSFIVLKFINSLKLDKLKLQEELLELRSNFMYEREKSIKIEETLSAHQVVSTHASNLS